MDTLKLIFAARTQTGRCLLPLWKQAVKENHECVKLVILQMTEIRDQAVAMLFFRVDQLPVELGPVQIFTDLIQPGAGLSRATLKTVAGLAPL